MTTEARCPEDRMKTLLSGMKAKDGRGMAGLDEAIESWPSDPRLRFLRGSMLAAQERYADAKTEMRRAVDLAPDFAIARFQLGLLLLSSGDAFGALETLGPLQALAPENYLRLFASGLCALVRDDFAGAAAQLRQGIARNHDNPAMNRDMQLIVARLGEKGDDGKLLSSVGLLLRQAAFRAEED